MRSLAALIALIAMGYVIFRTSRESARESPSARRRAIMGSVIMTVTGALLAFWLPRRVPETEGSPASLVAIVLLWVLGGCLLFAGIAALAGGVAARPSGTDRFAASEGEW